MLIGSSPNDCWYLSVVLGTTKLPEESSTKRLTFANKKVKKAKLTIVLSGRKHFLFSPVELFPSFVWPISRLRLLFPLTLLSSKLRYNGFDCRVIVFKCSRVILRETS